MSTVVPRDFRLRYEGGTLRATWTASSVPEGCSVEVVFTGADGTDLAPQPTIDYSAGMATVTSPVAVGTTFLARARVVSAAVRATVSTHDIGVVRDLVVEWRGGALGVTWTAPAGDAPAGYEVVLLDAARVPLSPRPVFTAGRFDGGALQDSTEYVVSVRGERDGSVGPWAYAPHTVDKRLPESDVLRALLRRLRAAISTGTGSLALAPDVVSAPNITSLYGSLLGFPRDTVTVTAAEVTSEPGWVTVTGTIALPLAERPTVSAEWIFRAEDATIHATMTVADLGGYTPDALVRRGIVPTSEAGAAVWGAGLPTLPRLSMTLASHIGEVRFGGDPSATPWLVPVGLSGVSFGTATPAMRRTGTGHVPQVTTELRLGSATTIPVRLSIPAGRSGWVVEQTGGPRDIGRAHALDSLVGGIGWDLPQGLLDLEQFTVTALVVEFPAAPSPDVWQVATELDVAAAAGPWRCLGGAVTLARLHVTLHKLRVREDGGITGRAGGSITALLVVADAVRVEATVDIPASDGTWELRGSARLREFAFTGLARFFGGDAAPLTGLLAKVGTLGAAELTEVGLRFTPAGDSAGLHSLTVRAGISRWTVPALPWFSVDAVRLGIEVDDPLTATRAISGDLAGTFTLGTARFWLLARFDKDGWSASASASGTRITTLDRLTDIVPKDTVTGFLAEAPVATEFGLAALTLAYDFRAGRLSRAGFLLHSTVVWHWLDKAVALRGITVDLTAHREQAAWSVSGRIAGRITLARAEIGMEATKAAGGPWSFHGALEHDVTVDFADVLGALAKSLRLPSGHGLPSTLVVEELTVDVVPATGKADLVGASRLEWSAGLGAGTVAMVGLGAELHLPASTGALTGRFSMGAVTGSGRIAFGADDTVIDARVTGSATVAAVVDQVAGPGTYTAVRAPSAFHRPAGLVDVTLNVNLTRNRLLLVGRHTADTRYAAVALLVTKAATTWEFALALALHRFSAGDVSPALSGVDTELGVSGDRAAVVLSSLTGKADADLHAKVPALPEGTELRPGLTFCVRLDLSRGLAAAVASVVGLTGDCVVTGHVPADVDEPVRLSAALPKLRLFAMFDFDGVVLTYVRTPAKGTVPASSTLALSGDVVAHLDGVAHTFHGDLVVTTQRATFRVQLAYRVANPLGVPGLSLDKLGIDLARDIVPNRTTTSLFGEMAFTSGPTLRGDIVLVDGAAVLVLVRLLDKELAPARLSISTLLAQTTGLAWPQVLDVVLENGWLSYVPGPVPVEHDGLTHRPGLHAAADVTVSILPKARLDVTVYGTDTATHRKGLTATAQILAPVDWGFVTFAGTATHGGPSSGPWLSIDTAKTAAPFTVATNLTLLGVELADVEISVGRDRMRGTVTLPAKAGPFAGSTLAFTWDERGLRVEKWPLPNLSLPEFSFDDLKGSGTCAAKRVLQSLPVRSGFTLDATLAIELGTPATLVVTFAGTFTLETTSWAHRDDPIITVPIASARLRVPFPGAKGYDWAALADGFVGAIKEAASSVFENLLADPKTLAKLAAVAGARWAVGEAVGYLQCRGMSREAAETAVDGAMSTAVVTVGVCAAGTAAVGGVVGSLAGGVFTLAGARLPGHTPPRTPARPTMSFDTTTLTVSWVATDATGYGVELTDDAGGHVPVSLTVGTTVRVDLAAIRAHSGLGRTLTARVHPVGLGGRGTPSEPATLFLLAEPATPRLVFHDGEARRLTVAWSALPKATEHDVQVLDSAGSPLLTERALAVERAELDSTRLSGKSGLRIRLRGRAQGVVGAWGPTADLTLPVLPAPNGLRAVHGVDRVEASWVGGPEVGYTAQLVTGGVPAPAQPVFTITDAAATFPADGLRPGDELRVRATSVLGAGPWSARVRLPFSPVPTGYLPVLAWDLESFAAAFFGVPAGSTARVERGGYEWLNATMIPARMDSGHGIIQFGVIPGTSTPRTVVLSSPVPLTSFWSDPGMVVSHWTSTGWRTGQQPTPVRGLYFHRLDFPAGRGRIELGADRPGPIAALAPGTDGALPSGFVPVLATTAGDLARQVLDLPSVPAAALTHGTLTPGGAVGGDSATGVDLTLDEPVTVTTDIIVCTTEELTRWQWVTSDGDRAGTRVAWTHSGWQQMTDDRLPRVAWAARRYYYRVRLTQASIGGPARPFCSLRADSSFTAAFFVAPVPEP